jgi:hypothetical protein
VPGSRIANFYALLARGELFSSESLRASGLYFCSRNYTRETLRLAKKCDALIISAVVDELLNINSVRFLPDADNPQDIIEITAEDAFSGNDSNIKISAAIGHTAAILESVKKALNVCVYSIPGLPIAPDACPGKKAPDVCSNARYKSLAANEILNARRQLKAGNLFSDFSETDLQISIAPLSYVFERLANLCTDIDSATLNELEPLYLDLTNPDILDPTVREAVANFTAEWKKSDPACPCLLPLADRKRHRSLPPQKQSEESSPEIAAATLTGYHTTNSRRLPRRSAARGCRFPLCAPGLSRLSDRRS